MIDEKHYKDLVIYFTRHFHSKSIKIFCLHYYELMGKIKEHEGKNCLMVDDYMLVKTEVLDRIKKIIGIEEFDSTKILVDTNDKLPDDITLRNNVICVIKDDCKFYPQLFLEEALFLKETCNEKIMLEKMLWRT